MKHARVSLVFGVFFLLGCGGNTSEIDSAGSGGVFGGGGGVDAATPMGGSGGVAGNAPVSCDTQNGVQILGACRVLVTSSDPKPGPVPGFSLTGPVLETGPANASECHAGATSPDAFEFQMAGAPGEVWKFSVLVPGFENPLKKGEVVEVTAASSTATTFGAVEPYITVRDANGALLFHVTEGREAADLFLPIGLSAALGDSICSGSDECGAWTHHSLVVSQGAESAVVPYLGSSTLGAYRLIHGGAEVPTTTTSCHGGQVGLAIVGLD